MTAQENLHPEQFDMVFTKDYHGRHAVTVWPPGQVGTEYDQPIGSLHWHPDRGTVTYLNVDENHRRQGIASSLWIRAREESARNGLHEPAHSSSRSPAGDAWAHAVGGVLPPREAMS